jgi:hypothetical protein
MKQHPWFQGPKIVNVSQPDGGEEVMTSEEHELLMQSVVATVSEEFGPEVGDEITFAITLQDSPQLAEMEDYAEAHDLFFSHAIVELVHKGLSAIQTEAGRSS